MVSEQTVRSGTNPHHPMELIELTWSMPIGQPGVDASQENPLARSTRKLFADGKPFLRLSQCFFRGEDTQLRWFGVFVHSAGERLLFFPGFAEPFKHVIAYNGSVPRWNEGFLVDHLTLERDRRSSHLTSPGSLEHLGKLGTLQIDSAKTFWFSMSMASESALCPAYTETRVSVAAPHKDVDRRAQAFVSAREGSDFPIIELHKEYATTQSPRFLHFSVIVGPPGFEDTDNQVYGIPHGSPFVDPLITQELKRLPVREHRVRLSENIELQIIATVLPGKLLTPVCFASSLESR